MRDDRELVVQREVDAVGLRAVAQRGVEQIEAFAAHRLTRGNSSAPARPRPAMTIVEHDVMQWRGTARLHRAAPCSFFFIVVLVSHSSPTETVLRCSAQKPRARRTRARCRSPRPSAAGAARGGELLERVEQHACRRPARPPPDARRAGRSRSAPSSEMKPTGEPSMVAISVRCLPSRSANASRSSAADGPGLLLRRVVVVLGQFLDAGAEDLGQQRRVLRQDTAAARIADCARALIARPPRWCRPWSPSAPRPSRRARRGCGRIRRSSWPCARRCARRSGFRSPPSGSAGCGACFACHAFSSSRPEAEERQRAGQRLAAGRVLQAVHLGDRLRRVEVVEQRIEHRRRRTRIGLGRRRIDRSSPAPSRPPPAPSRSS